MKKYFYEGEGIAYVSGEVEAETQEEAEQLAREEAGYDLVHIDTLIVNEADDD